MLRRISFLLCSLLAVTALAQAPAEKGAKDKAVNPPLKVGDAFPKIVEIPGIAMLGGGNLPPTAGQVMLVDFWASWCAPCKASFPALGKIHTDYNRRGLVIAAVSIDDKMSDAMQFLRSNRAPFVTLLDREKNLVKTVVVPTMPTTYLIGRDGKVRYMHVGYHGAETDKLLRQQIDTLLSEKMP